MPRITLRRPARTPGPSASQDRIVMHTVEHRDVGNGTREVLVLGYIDSDGKDAIEQVFPPMRPFLEGVSREEQREMLQCLRSATQASVTDSIVERLGGRWSTMRAMAMLADEPNVPRGRPPTAFRDWVHCADYTIMQTRRAWMAYDHEHLWVAEKRHDITMAYMEAYGMDHWQDRYTKALMVYACKLLGDD